MRNIAKAQVIHGPFEDQFIALSARIDAYRPLDEGGLSGPALAPMISYFLCGSSTTPRSLREHRRHPAELVRPRKSIPLPSWSHAPH